MITARMEMKIDMFNMKDTSNLVHFVYISYYMNIIMMDGKGEYIP